MVFSPYIFRLTSVPDTDSSQKTKKNDYLWYVFKKNHEDRRLKEVTRQHHQSAQQSNRDFSYSFYTYKRETSAYIQAPFLCCAPFQHACGKLQWIYQEEAHYRP